MAQGIPLIAHVVHHFGVGGLENGMVNLINHLPASRYRHAIVCLDGFTDFRRRITEQEVEFFALGKRPGHDIDLYRRLWKQLRALKPDIVHTRNLSALEGQFVAAAAGVRGRIHGEHGRDVFDLEGKSRKYNMLRRAARPLVNRYITVSKDLEQWLIDTVGVPPGRIRQIYNGVDSMRFHLRQAGRPAILPPGFVPEGGIVFGSVGRMAAVKDYPSLVRAFLQLLRSEPAARARARLVIIGEGMARTECLQLLAQGGAADLAWLPGERTDVAELMRAMDVFVLPSLGEGISNTILEAMASALPIVATRVGGNVELVREGENGMLVPPAQPELMAQALLGYFRDPALLRRHGEHSRRRIEADFSMAAMAQGYQSVYDQVLGGKADRSPIAALHR